MFINYFSFVVNQIITKCDFFFTRQTLTENFLQRVPATAMSFQPITNSASLDIEEGDFEIFPQNLKELVPLKVQEEIIGLLENNERVRNYSPLISLMILRFYFWKKRYFLKLMAFFFLFLVCALLPSSSSWVFPYLNQ